MTIRCRFLSKDRAIRRMASPTAAPVNTSLNENRLGLIAVINDLHKGRDTGKAWSGIIDVSAILMVLVSLSGLVLIFFLQKKLRSGLIALLIGTALCIRGIPDMGSVTRHPIAADR